MGWVSPLGFRLQFFLNFLFFTLLLASNPVPAQNLWNASLDDSNGLPAITNGSIPAGEIRFNATLSLAENIMISPTTIERFGTNNTSKWISNILDWEASPIDLSFLNQSERPAGKRGFVKAKSDQLVFEDGTVAKFWGTNIAAYSLFYTPRNLVKAQAKRLSALGFNLVRLHHHDSLWVDPNIFGAEKLNNTKTINEASIEKIDWWIKCLKEEGIYVWLDLHVDRPLKSGDGITAFDEIAKGESTASLKGYNYVNQSIQQAMRDFNTAYLNHVNKFTNIRYVDEPAIAAVLITNENDLTSHFGNALLADKGVPQHSKIFMAKASIFANTNDLSISKTSRTWEHGPSKLFLNDLERQFNFDMIRHLRQLGLKVPIVTTNTWGGNPLSSLPALTSGDMIDVHTYQPYGALEKNPLYSSNLVHWMAAAQVINKPMSISEWNAEPFPTADRHTLPLYVASQASFQGWDAIMQYAYAQEPLTGLGSPSNWQAYNDPSLLSTMPAAALMYRRGDIKMARTTYVLDLGKDVLFNQSITPENSAFIRTATELGKLVIAMPAVNELPWLLKSAIPSNAKIIKDPNISLLKAGSMEATTETGELKHNWQKGYLIVNTPMTQAVAGWIGKEKFTLDNVEISSYTPNATIIVQSADEASIRKSKRIIISLAAKSATEVDGKLPFLSEPVEARLLINAPKGLKLYKHFTEQKKKEMPVLYEHGRYIINLEKTAGTYWLYLTQ
ncbi:MAG: cellulase family glycosylhydrolase [Methylotenera sp.]